MELKKIVFFMLATLLILTGCTGKAQSGEENIVKIGALHPLSGGLANEGQEMRDAARLAVKEVNEAGGIKSLGGAKVELIEADHEGAPEKGMSEIQRLDREKVVGVIGAYSSGVTLPATQEAERAGIPFVVDIATVEEVTERGFKYTFRVQPPASMMAENFLEYFDVLNEMSETPLETVVLVHEDSVFGTSIASLIEKGASDHQIDVLDNIPHAATAADISSTINKINRLKPDAVIATTYLRDGTLLVNGLKQSNFQPKVIIGVANGAFSNTAFINDETDINQHIMDVNYSINPQSELALEVSQKYEDQFNKHMGPNAAYSYTATKVLIDAVERAGSTDRAKIQEALSETNLTEHILPQDTIVFDESGQNANAQAVLNQIINGETKVIYPDEYKNADPVLPTK